MRTVNGGHCPNASTKQQMNCKACRATWDEGRKVIVLNDKHTFARGLTKTLSACFSPEFSIAVTLKGVADIKPKKRGKYIGNSIDKQLTEWVEKVGVKPNAPSDARLVRIISVLKEQKWTPVTSQLALGCSSLRLGTKLDLLCRDNTGSLILIEVKCGFDDYYDICNQGNFQYPFEDVAISFRNKHFLQLWVTRWLFTHSRHEYSGEPLNKYSYVMRIFEKKHSEIDSELSVLPEWLCDNKMTLCLRVLESTKNLTFRIRNRIMKNGSKRSRYNFKSKKQKI